MKINKSRSIEMNPDEVRWFNLIQRQLAGIKFGSVKVELIKRNGKIVRAKIIQEESLEI